MSNDERKTWMASLKVGDEVFVPERYGAGRIYKVTKRTPTGRVHAGPFMFNPDGWQRGGNSWSSRHIEPVTVEAREQVERDQLIYLLKDTRWEQLGIETLREIAARL